jgi:hypothetical protein
MLAVIAAALPGAPARPDVTDVDATAISIAWATPADMRGSPVTGYRVYRFDGVALNTVAEPEPVKAEVQTLVFLALLPVPEKQLVSVQATGGSFRLSIGGQQTGSIAFNAAQGAVQAALEALSATALAAHPGTGVTVLRSGSGSSFVYTVTFAKDALVGHVEPLVVDGSALAGPGRDAP